MTIADKIRSLRKQKNITQSEMAEAIGVDRTNISMWESGKSKPSNSSIKSIAAYFKVPIDLLMVDDVNMIAANKNESLNAERAILLALLDDYTYLKSKVEGISYEEAKSALKQKAGLVLQSLESWMP